MEAFYVTAKADATELTLVFAQNVFRHREDVGLLQGAPMLAKRQGLQQLKVNVQAGNLKAATLLVNSLSDVHTETLFDDEVQPKLAVFTVSDGKAYNINKVDETSVVPLGIFVEGMQSVTFDFNALGEFDTSLFTLLDKQTGMSYELTSPITFEDVTSSVGRFVLMGNAASTTGVDNSLANTDITITVIGHEAVITVPAADVQSVSVYSTDGSRSSEVYALGHKVVNAKLIDGVNLLRIRYNDGTQKNYKVQAR